MIGRKIGYWELLIELARSVLGSFVRPKTLSFDDVAEQMRSVGLGAAPTACLITLTAGYVLALVLAVQLNQIGKSELVPTLLWIMATEQVVPLGVAFIFTGRSVSSVTAELGAMQISEEIKALFTMGVDLVPFLLLPRFLAFQLMLPLVTLAGIYAALAGGWILCASLLGMSTTEYISYAFAGSHLGSLLTSLGKSAVFAFIIATISFYKGLNVRNGPREISTATTSSVVTSVVVVTVTNALLTSLQLRI